MKDERLRLKNYNITIMNKKVNAKREAYAKKQEEKGRKVVLWIIGALIALAVVYMCWTYSMMA